MWLVGLVDKPGFGYSVKKGAIRYGRTYMYTYKITKQEL